MKKKIFFFLIFSEIEKKSLCGTLQIFIFFTILDFSSLRTVFVSGNVRITVIKNRQLKYYNKIILFPGYYTFI